MAAARGMLTTDTVPQAGRPDGDASAAATYQITGMAKGAAMMGPNMATMLALIMTDAPLDRPTAQAALRRRGRRELQLHERRRPHEHQRHGAAAGQRRGRRRAAGRRRTWPCSSTPSTKCASTWPRRSPATAKGRRTW